MGRRPVSRECRKPVRQERKNPMRLWIMASVIVAASTAAWAAHGGEPMKEWLGDPKVEFSSDEAVVSISCKSGSWKFNRPVVSPWKYVAQGKTYWVATTGDDANDGSEAKPFKSVQLAVDKSAPGDIIYIKAGVYEQGIKFFKHSGQEGRPIIVSCAPGALGKVVINPPNDYYTKIYHPVMVQGSQYIWINGLVIEGARGRPGSPESLYKASTDSCGVFFCNGGGKGCRVTNSVSCYHTHCGMKEAGHGGTGILFEANVMFENGMGSLDHAIYLPTDDHIVNGNIAFNGPGYGLHLYSAPNRLTVTRNICFGFAYSGIIIAGYKDKDGQHHGNEDLVFNNVCTDNRWGLMLYSKGGKDNLIKNNILAFNTDASLMYGDRLPADNPEDYNCYFPHEGKAAKLTVAKAAHTIVADPLLRDRKAGDFRLKPGSPCIGTGVDVGLPFTGKTPDRGAFDANGAPAKGTEDMAFWDKLRQAAFGKGPMPAKDTGAEKAK